MLRSLYRSARCAEPYLARPILPSASLPFTVNKTRAFRNIILPASIVSSIRPFSVSPPRLQSVEAVNYSAPQDADVIDGISGENGLPDFEDLREKLHPVLVDTIVSDLRLKTMTEVQARTLDAVLKGVDV